MKTTLILTLISSLTFLVPGKEESDDPSGAKVIFYEHPNFGGRSFSFSNSSSNIGAGSGADSFSSAVVLDGAVMVFWDPEYMGQSAQLCEDGGSDGDGRYKHLNNKGADQISSLIILSKIAPGKKCN